MSNVSISHLDTRTSVSSAPAQSITSISYEQMLKLCFLIPLYFLFLIGAVAVPSHGQDRVHERTVASNPRAGSPTRPTVYLPVQTGHAMVCNRLHGDRGHMPMQRHCLDYCKCDSRGIVLCYRKSGRSAPIHISVWSEDAFRSQNLIPNLLRPDISPGSQPLPSRTSLKRLHTVCRSRCRCEAIPRPRDMPSHYWDALFPPTLVQRSPAGDGPSAGPSSQRAKPDSPNPRAPSREPSTRSSPPADHGLSAGQSSSPNRGASYGRRESIAADDTASDHSPSSAHSPSSNGGAPLHSPHLECTPSGSRHGSEPGPLSDFHTPSSGNGPFGHPWLFSPESRQTTGRTSGSTASDHSSAGHSRLLERPFELRCQMQHCQISCRCDRKGAVKCDEWLNMDRQTMTWVCGRYGSCQC